MTRPPYAFPVDATSVVALRVVRCYARLVRGTPHEEADWYQREASAIRRGLEDCQPTPTLAAYRRGPLRRDLIRACGAAAALSPRSHWENAREAAITMVAVGVRPRGFYGASIRRAERAVRAESTSDLLAQPWGPKVGPFLRALLGERFAVPLDVWSLAVAGFWDRTRTPPPTLRSRILHGYHEAAGVLQVPPALVQARTWAAFRERYSGTRGAGRADAIRSLGPVLALPPEPV